MVFEGHWCGDMPPAAVVLVLVSNKTITFMQTSYHSYTNAQNVNRFSHSSPITAANSSLSK